MKNELLKNKIIDSIASKTVSDNLIYLSIAIIKNNRNTINDNEYEHLIKNLLKTAFENRLTKDIISKKINSINIENYAGCITIKQARAISYICRDGNYTYDKNYLPDAVCGFISDEEYVSMLKDFGFSQKDDISKNNDVNNTIDVTSDNTMNTNVKSINKNQKNMERLYEIIDTLNPLVWNNKRIVLTNHITQVFGMSSSMFLNRFYKLRKRNKFELEQDYYLLEGAELKKFYELNNLENYTAASLYIWTQNGVSLFA